MRLLVVFGMVLTALGVVGFLWRMSFIAHERQAGVGAVAGGIAPLMLLGIVGILLLIVAAVVRVLRH
jgi:hypothetical protein